MAGVEKVLAERRTALKLGVIIDPDGDRTRFSIEARTEEGKKAVFETAARITKEAWEM